MAPPVRAGILLLIFGCVCGYDWSSVEKAVLGAIEQKIFPGAVVGVALSEGVVFMRAFGNLTYGQKPTSTSQNQPMELGTAFDMASCTKVLATTSAVATFYQVK